MLKKLRSKGGSFKNFLIDSRGAISWSGEGDYVPTTRIKGKRKQYEQVQLMRGGEPQMVLRP